MPFRRLFVIGLPAIGRVLAACTPFTNDLVTDAALPLESSVDAPSGDADVDGPPPCDTSQPFGAPTFVAGLSNTAGDAVLGLRLSHDYLTGYFAANYDPSGAGSTALYSATRVTANSSFENMSLLAGTAVTSVDYEKSPNVTRDGLTLIFERAPVAGTAGHISYATRATTSAPFTYIGEVANVNSAGAFDENPYLRDDEQVLYFSSTRVAGDDLDIFRAPSNGSAFGPPLPVSELNTSYLDDAPVVTPDDLTLFFASSRPGDGARGGVDIWTATRGSTDDPFSAPTDVTELNTSDNDYPSFITRDGCTLYLYVEASTLDGYHSIYVAQRPAL